MKLLILLLLGIGGPASAKTVVACEGLSPFLVLPTRYIQRQTIPPLVAAGKKIEVVSNQWYMGCPRVGDDAIWIIHSMGNGCQNCVKNSPLVISFDPRVSGAFFKPPGVKRWVNYYQTGFMRGYPIEGAENNFIRGVGHTAMPSLPQAQKELEGAL